MKSNEVGFNMKLFISNGNSPGKIQISIKFLYMYVGWTDKLKLAVFGFDR